MSLSAGRRRCTGTGSIDTRLTQNVKQTRMKREDEKMYSYEMNKANKTELFHSQQIFTMAIHSALYILLYHANENRCLLCSILYCISWLWSLIELIAMLCIHTSCRDLCVSLLLHSAAVQKLSVFALSFFLLILCWSRIILFETNFRYAVPFSLPALSTCIPQIHFSLHCLAYFLF